MSIQKKSLISTLKTAKKANVASQGTEDLNSKPSKVMSKRAVTSSKRAVTVSKRSVTVSKRRLQ